VGSDVGRDARGALRSFGQSDQGLFCTEEPLTKRRFDLGLGEGSPGIEQAFEVESLVAS